MSVSVSSSTRRRGSRLPVVPAIPGDHPAIYYFLTAVFQDPSRAEFNASLEDPFYEPSDRLLLKRGSRIAAHAHVTHRLMQFGSSEIPVAGLGWLGTMPQFRNRGYARRLLRAAERKMAADGALLGMLKTDVPHFFRPSGWALCGRHCHSRASARAVLCELLDRGLFRNRRRLLNIRPWRRVEMQSLLRIYNQNLVGQFGPLVRSEAYWQWLISRRAYDQLYVALDGPDLLELEENNAPIVGYAVTRGERIVELATVPGHRTAAVQLLARTCKDAIERDCHAVKLHAPSGSRLHKLFQTAGGVRHHHEADRGEVFMTRLLEPVKFLRAIAGQLHQRAEAANVPRPLELGFLVDGKKYRLMLTLNGVRAAGCNTGRSYLRLNVADFTRLVLGQFDWDRALLEGRLEASTNIALKAGQALFPHLSLWRPPFDELPA